MKFPLRHVRLPSANSIYAYLKEIDKNNWYTNRGKLVQEFEQRLANHFSVSPSQVTVVNNATSGLALALLATDAKSGMPCIMTSLSFAACPSAATSAGLIPVFADVDPMTLMLTPQSIMPVIKELGGTEQVGAVMPVSLYGAPIDHKSWQEFRDRTKIPVIVDAAWCFDSLNVDALPAVISLHATKVCEIGEGGIVIAQDEEFIERIKQSANFGLDRDRSVVRFGFNGKLSEYGAAVGLAALDEWQPLRIELLEKAQLYATSFERLSDVQIANGVDGAWAPATVLIKLSKPIADDVSKQLSDEGIEARHWWGELNTDQPAMAEFKRADLIHSKDAIMRILIPRSRQNPKFVVGYEAEIV